MEHFLFSLNVILPILLTVLLGYLLKIFKILPKEFFVSANKLVYYVLLPLLLFYNVYNIESLTQIYWPFIGFAMLMISIIFLLSFIYVHFFIKERRQKAAIHLGIFRGNFAIIGLPLAIAIAGADSQAVVLGTLVAAFNMPLVNMYSFISLSVYSDDRSQITLKYLLKKIFFNPLSIAVFIGLIVVIIRIFLLENTLESNFTIKNNINFLYIFIRSLSNMATPFALIALGGKFSFSTVSHLKGVITTTVLIRSFLVPIIALGIGYLVGFRSVEFPALIALFATPVSVSSVPMAQQMNADDELVGQLVVWTTLVSTFSIFLIILLTSLLYLV